MPLSPRIRADFLLMIANPTARQCLESFATVQGVAMCTTFSNIVAKASTVFPGLPQLLDALPPEFVAYQVNQFLDGDNGAQGTDDAQLLGDLLAD